MTSVNSLVNIAVFGIGGAILVAALIGLLLVVSGSAHGSSPRLLTAFGGASVVLLVVLPALAALNVMAGGGGFWAGLVNATVVAALMYAVNVALLPVLARRQAMVSGRPGLTDLRPSASVLLGGLVVCLGVGLLVTGVTAFVV
ncbi:hypothetical protein GCM10007079_50570 [Nocardiopsis terrae]|uniref:Integral membrane protein n=1 Tax=Nocardiopsis terrae TaxID=372655 RepID=A0ABR9HK87_9ACTN|nr:hypothetical protein [Nocardiopsis terrae]MBE1459429.1 hypothetical protein [Nocardiopsis terrae]GHC97233.1 hypothetical protein GCM10007079_50570 [Nocardiopsis terrae]